MVCFLMLLVHILALYSAFIYVHSFLFFSRPQVQKVEFIKTLRSFFVCLFCVPLSLKKKKSILFSQLLQSYFSSSLDIFMCTFKICGVAYPWRCSQFAQMTLHYRAYIFYIFHWALAFRDLFMSLCEHEVLGCGASVIALPAG